MRRPTGRPGLRRLACVGAVATLTAVSACSGDARSSGDGQDGTLTVVALGTPSG